ncbi:hypothetical protein MLD38_015727 [Melastoma candidum]|uniref:Uncharacterized protein n=1 Tax=Melastoma candidum TaxID=119954 RepID=A0ACB9RQJ1_9MYRT|nr:hypothetical protein MLD38_015727 [Melastoma candidum]
MMEDIPKNGVSAVQTLRNNIMASTLHGHPCGLRAFYFSFPLFLWIFGPVPMAVTCVSLVFGLYKPDAPKGRVGLAGVCEDGRSDDDEEVGRKSRGRGANLQAILHGLAIYA